jgi:Fur family ferric uptake transcriptional regulator
MKNTINLIRQKGGRLTKIKRTIINILVNSGCLISKKDLVDKLKKQNLNPHRSTLYRELQLLIHCGIVFKQVIAGDEYYEIPQSHHHHLICLNCKQIQTVTIEDNLSQQEKEIQSKNKFKTVHHSLDFYGLCNNCLTF